MRTASGFLNLMLAGVFSLLAVQWFQEGSTGWAAFAGLAVAMNLVLAVLKFRERKAGADAGAAGDGPDHGSGDGTGEGEGKNP